MSGHIRIRNLALYARHGVLDAEREIGQRFYVDVMIAADLSAAAASDDLADTISYADVIETVTKAFTERPERLLERLADRLARVVLDTYPRADAVEIAIRKPGAPIAAVFDHVEVSIRLARNG